MKRTELSDTVDQVESLIKKHDAFESLLATQDAKVSYSHMLYIRVTSLKVKKVRYLI